MDEWGRSRHKRNRPDADLFTHADPPDALDLGERGESERNVGLPSELSRKEQRVLVRIQPLGAKNAGEAVDEPMEVVAGGEDIDCPKPRAEPDRSSPEPVVLS